MNKHLNKKNRNGTFDKIYIKYLLVFSFLAGGILLLTIVFANNDSLLPYGLVMSKVFLFSKYITLFTCIIFLYGIIVYKSQIRTTLSDLFVFFFYVITLLTYHWVMDPGSEKIIIGGQLVILWFGLKIILKDYPVIGKVFLTTVLLTGLVEAAWGLQQLYGYKTSTHHLYHLTGSFINPGPYSGYLAVVLPVCLGFLLDTDNADNTDKKVVFKIKAKEWTILALSYWLKWGVYYFAWICLIGILVVLPAGMSRSAWVSAVLSCGWVYWWQCIGWERTKDFWKKRRKRILLVGISILIVIIVAFIGIYSLKKDSANGRFLMWKVTALAISKQPITGVGLGGFPAAYAETQAEYFASGKGTEREKMVAGCPEYAFNEYLQIALEQGIFGLLFFLGWLGLCLYKGIKNKHYGVTGGIVALMVFAFSSYPLQLPSFWILLIFLCVISLTPDNSNLSFKDLFISNPATPKVPGGTGVASYSKKINTKEHWKISYLLIGVIMFSASFFLYYRQKDMEAAYRKWNKARIIYNSNAYESAYPIYEELYPQLNHKPEFLFEAGQCLSKMQRYEESNTLLERATLLSSDPMIHYIIGKNEQMLGHCDKAEERLLHAINILPERIYPYYLLTKLYSDSTCYQPEKLCIAADSVLHKKPKVMSTAIREMREETEKLMIND